MNKKQLLMLGFCLGLYSFHSQANAASKKCYTRMTSYFSAESISFKNTTGEVNHGTLQYPKNSACKAAALREYTKLLGPRANQQKREELCVFWVISPANGTLVVWRPLTVWVDIVWDRSKNSTRNWEPSASRRLPCS